MWKSKCPFISCSEMNIMYIKNDHGFCLAYNNILIRRPLVCWHTIGCQLKKISDDKKLPESHHSKHGKE